MVDERNVMFEKLPAGCPFQLEFNPKEMPMTITDDCNSSELYNKIQTFQHLGFHIEIDLIWTGPVFFDENQYGILKDLFADRKAFYIYPNPSAEPELKFLVNWTGNLDFKSATGWQDGWGYYGTMHLVGAESYTKDMLPDWVFSQEDS